MVGSKHKTTLDRLMWRSRLKALLQLSGILLVLVGGLYLPACRGPLGPKSTIFNWVTTTGTFAESGLILIVVGAAVIAASLLVKGGGPFD